NFLLLDEPTNHLDIEMRHALTLALQAFNGALVIVSHDRHLLRCCADMLWLVADGSLTLFDDDLDAYTDWLSAQRKLATDEQPRPAAAVDNSAASRKEKKRLEADARKKIQPLRKRAQSLEKQVEEVAAKLAGVELKLAEPALYEATDNQQLQSLMLEQAGLKKQQEQLEGDWLQALEDLEQASQSLA
ncbi:MAG: ABC transporter ATP-binding protein, partial [Gammaproteobacteria bacterium]|nr:ABC transporter ATP-binding protein [Gammaproteobacteria bacterium]